LIVNMRPYRLAKAIERHLLNEGGAGGPLPRPPEVSAELVALLIEATTRRPETAHALLSDIELDITPVPSGPDSPAAANAAAAAAAAAAAVAAAVKAKVAAGNGKGNGGGGQSKAAREAAEREAAALEAAAYDSDDDYVPLLPPCSALVDLPVVRPLTYVSPTNFSCFVPAIE